jgi:hypothetical protein
MAQAMYIHVSRCENDKIKGEKEKNIKKPKKPQTKKLISSLIFNSKVPLYNLVLT